MFLEMSYGAYYKMQQTLDVIAQFNRDGGIIPLKIRIYDENVIGPVPLSTPLSTSTETVNF